MARKKRRRQKPGDMPPRPPATIEEMSVSRFAEKAYLDYSMYVVLDRALPHLADGLKPVQRRILYAMSELGLGPGAKFKKSARTVGDVIGKYHPHGDAAAYEAMVLMAQPFSFRYPLVEGQGNWGSQDDPKSFAAMRYTEARITPFAEVLLEELDQGTVDWAKNFDGTMKEPKLFPARLPHVLLNGSSGIAVGLATEVPSHNVGEVAAACVHLLDDPEASIEELCQHILGPDFPTEAEIITPADEIQALYETGSGSVRMRATWERIGSEIVIHTLPYQVSGGKVLTQIAGQMQAKKLPMVVDLRDESDFESPTRLVVEMRSNRVDSQGLMAHLFATTDLEKSYRVQLNIIGLRGRPRLYNLKDLLQEWLEFRIATVRRRLEFRFEKVRSRLHVLEGLLVAHLNIDEVIRIIRREDKPKPRLMERFELTDVQAEAILELKLRHLAKLEEMKIRGEQDTLTREHDQLLTILGSQKALVRHVREEIREDGKRFGDPRRSPVVQREAARALSETDLIPSEPVTVVLSENGWVRAAKGHEMDPSTLPYRAGDRFLTAARGRSNLPAVFLDSTGRAYTLPTHTLPTARGHGEPLSSSLNPPPGAVFVAVIQGADDDLLLLGSTAGFGFLARIADLVSQKKAGKVVVQIPGGSEPLSPMAVRDPDKDHVAVVTDQGRFLVFPAEELPRLGKGKGQRLATLGKSKRYGDEAVLFVAVVPEKTVVRLHAGKRYINLSGKELDAYRGARATRGQKLPRGFQNVTGMEVLTRGGKSPLVEEETE